jgi:Fe-S-cluster containining protein
MADDKLSGQVLPIMPGEVFSFLCHKHVSCFTDCCRELELIITPYDVLRLRRATGLQSSELHQRYIIEEFTDDDRFPRFYLSMVDDGRASCVFVNHAGCSIYDHRPGACRTYPLGRGTARDPDTGVVSERFIVLREPHCCGFKEKTVQTIQSFMNSQELEPYNRFNDLLTAITQHPSWADGMQPNEIQINLFRLALYDLDTFRSRLTGGEADKAVSSPLAVPSEVFEDDEALLEFSMRYIYTLFFDS